MFRIGYVVGIAAKGVSLGYHSPIIFLINKTSNHKEE